MRLSQFYKTSSKHSTASYQTQYIAKKYVHKEPISGCQLISIVVCLATVPRIHPRLPLPCPPRGHGEILCCVIVITEFSEL